MSRTRTTPTRCQIKKNVRYLLLSTRRRRCHAGVAAKAHQRRKLERLCRYIARPAVATDRLALTPQGYVRYTLKPPYRDGTTHIILEPLDFIARLAALVPKPRVNLTRFHGVFTPNSGLRQQVTPARRGKRRLDIARTPAQRRATMTWAQRLKRVFKIDIETCDQCGGVVNCPQAPFIRQALPLKFLSVAGRGETSWRNLYCLILRGYADVARSSAYPV